MKKALILLIVGVMLFSPVLALGQDPEVPEVPRQVYWEDEGDIVDLLHRILDWIYLVVGILIVVMILYAGYQFLTAGGDAERFGAAQKTLLYALIGVAAILLAWGVVAFVESLLVS